VIRVLGSVSRRKGISHQEFRDRYKEHVPVVKELPNLRGYTQLVPVNPDRCPYDGIGVLEFDDVEAVRAAFDTPAGSHQFVDAERFAILPDAEDPHEAAHENVLSMMFESQVEIDV